MHEYYINSTFKIPEILKNRHTPRLRLPFLGWKAMHELIRFIRFVSTTCTFGSLLFLS